MVYYSGTVVVLFGTRSLGWKVEMLRLNVLLVTIPWLCLAQTSCPIKNTIPSCECQSSAIICPDAKLTELPDPSLVPEEFTTLEMDGNSFGELTFVPYPQLRALRLRNSGITSIAENAFSNLTELVELDLSSNLIENILRPMFKGLGKLEKMILPSNKMKSISAHALCPGLMPNVMHLNLEYNQIEEIQASNIMYPKLAYLNLGYNKLSKVPTVIWSKSTKIEQLLLEGNPLKTIPAHAFHNLTQIKIVNADTCNLTDIDNDAFHGVSTVTHLYLGNNQLTTFPAAITQPLKNLQELHLQNNNLQYVEYDVVRNVKTLRLDHNKWHCDCKIKWMAGLRPSDNNTQYLCTSPQEVAAKPISEVLGPMSCKSNRGVIALAIGIPILIICAGLIAFFLWRIAKARRAEDKRKSVRYSAVYRDTVEQKQGDVKA